MKGRFLLHLPPSRARTFNANVVCVKKHRVNVNRVFCRMAEEASAANAPILSPTEQWLIRFLNMPFFLVVPGLISAMAALLYAFFLATSEDVLR